jgi:hypothetical protein
MFKEALRSEIVSPPELLHKLHENGLVGVDITIEEFYYAIDLGNRYNKLSGYDRIALSIAKYRNIRLLTGDNALRKAAAKENVEVFGTIGLLDELYHGNHIAKNEYEYCLKKLLENQERRLPHDELQKRIEDI